MIQEANLDDEAHQQAIISLLNIYAIDLRGYKRELPAAVLKDLIPEMKKLHTTVILLASCKEIFVGMAICFLGFSTFYARPLLNIHDFTVLKEYRGKGIGMKIMKAVERKARYLDCCKITLEVQEKNINAIRIYEKFGFNTSGYYETEGSVLFYSKVLVAKKE